MNRSPSDAIATLMRWREFQESLAANTYQQRNSDTAKAKRGLNEVTAVVRQVQDRCSALLENPHLDLALLQVAAQIEDTAWREMSARSIQLDASQAQSDEARAAHIEARARTRVAATRHERVVAAERDRFEKVMFDRMADMHASNRSRSR